MAERACILAALVQSFEALAVLLLPEHAACLTDAHLHAVVACRERLAMILAAVCRD